MANQYIRFPESEAASVATDVFVTNTSANPVPVTIDGTIAAATVMIEDSFGNPLASTNESLNVVQLAPAVFHNGQQTSSGTATQLTATSTPFTNGLIVQALSTNAANVYVGTSTVTTSNGFQLQPGQATSIAVNNANLVYVISTNSGDGVCYVGS